MNRKRLFTTRNLQYTRFYLVPLIAFTLMLVLLGFLVRDQRASELAGVRERLQLQTGLLSEKISSKLNTYEMTLEAIGFRASTLDLDVPQDRQELGIAVRQQLFLQTEIEGVCLISRDGEKIFSSFSLDFPELERTREAMMDAHLNRQIPFAQFVYIDHDARHLVLSRSLRDRGRDVKAIVALVVETDRFFDSLTQTAMPGIGGALLYDTEGTLFASWVLDDSVVITPFIEYERIQEIPEYSLFVQHMDDPSQLIGGERLIEFDDWMVALTQTANFPLTLGVHLSISQALKSFDRNMWLSFIVIISLMIASMFLVHLLVIQTRQKDTLQLQMVEELSVQVQQRTSELEHLSSYDTLTKLMNRRKFTEVLEQAIVRHDEQHVPFCIVCVDLDEFKQINDSWGHVVGDDVLVHVSSIMREGVGDRGAVGRWGGDELIILYQDCDGNRVLSLSDDIREQVDLNPYRKDIHCTVSMGVAEHRVGETSVELIRRADKALYEAKTAGKNCVR